MPYCTKTSNKYVYRKYTSSITRFKVRLGCISNVGFQIMALQKAQRTQWNKSQARTNWPVKVFRCANPNQAVSVGQLGKDTNFITIFKLCSDSHEKSGQREYLAWWNVPTFYSHMHWSCTVICNSCLVLMNILLVSARVSAGSSIFETEAWQPGTFARGWGGEGGGTKIKRAGNWFTDARFGVWGWFEKLRFRWRPRGSGKCRSQFSSLAQRIKSNPVLSSFLVLSHL